MSTDGVTTTKGALEGIRVLDLSAVVLGPMTAQYLGDMGADVIKIEPPEGDITRSIGPRRSEGMGALFLANNRNKRSVVLDLRKPDAQAVLRKMVAESDVLLHSIRASSVSDTRRTSAARLRRRSTASTRRATCSSRKAGSMERLRRTAGCSSRSARSASTPAISSVSTSRRAELRSPLSIRVRARRRICTRST